MVQLLAQFAFVDQIGQSDCFGAVDQRKGDLRIGVIAEHGLAHQKFVEVRIDQGPHNWINLPFVVPNPRSDVDHIRFPLLALPC